jgi:hypothetical protein
MNTKKIILSIPVHQITIVLIFALLIMSCASHKTIAPASSDHLSGTTPSIVPGNVVRVTLKTGETIRALKVTAVDSLRIAGSQSTFTLETKYDQSRIIRLTDIQSIKKRKICAFKTTGLVLILGSSPLWIWALSGSPL